MAFRNPQCPWFLRIRTSKGQRWQSTGTGTQAILLAEEQRQYSIQEEDDCALYLPKIVPSVCMFNIAMSTTLKTFNSKFKIRYPSY